MATKTFKIGLSATDKTNMAQDIYKRLLDLTFAEYDSSETYNTGDFVVYNDVLYQCKEDSVTGTWDSSKWEQATLQDLLDDVEDAVSQVNDKANVDGNYPTMTVGLADNLTPYGEDSGAEQSNPFISNGTGTNNNTEIVTVGDYGLLRSKNGNTLVVNQHIYIPSSSISKTENGITFVDNRDGTYTISTTPQGATETTSLTISNSQIINNADKTNHYFLITGCPSGGSLSSFRLQTTYGGWYDSGNGVIKQGTSSANTLGQLNIRINAGTIITTPITFKPKFIDLTQMFNGDSDIIDDITANPDHLSWYYNGSLAYNTGSLENANGVKLVSTGRNIWDEEWELGGITNTGILTNQTDRIRSKNYIRVIPNSTVYCFGAYCYFRFYDKDYNFVSLDSASASTMIVPSNAIYAKFFADPNYGTTYTNDITISLYYTPAQGGEGYDKYYPYEEPYVVDTGSEVLRSAGSVYDYKEPNGIIHRRIGSYTFTGNETWSKSNHAYYANIIAVSSIIKGVPTNSVANIICDVLVAKKVDRLYTYGDTETGIGTAPNGTIWIAELTYQSISSLTGKTIYFELATEGTPEQGTSFAENLPINDYGMLYWDNINGVPQGATIFFPVNYKGFVDDMYSRVDGDSSAYALNSELNAKFEAYLKSLSGYDSTATQVLKNVEGTLTWVTEE